MTDHPTPPGTEAGCECCRMNGEPGFHAGRCGSCGHSYPDHDSCAAAIEQARTAAAQPDAVMSRLYRLLDPEAQQAVREAFAGAERAFRKMARAVAEKPSTPAPDLARDGKLRERIRQAINDPGAFVKRAFDEDGNPMGSVGAWSMRAVMEVVQPEFASLRSELADMTTQRDEIERRSLSAGLERDRLINEVATERDQARAERDTEAAERDEKARVLAEVTADRDKAREWWARVSRDRDDLQGRLETAQVEASKLREELADASGTLRAAWNERDEKAAEAKHWFREWTKLGERAVHAEAERDKFGKLDKLRDAAATAHADVCDQRDALQARIDAALTWCTGGDDRDDFLRGYGQCARRVRMALDLEWDGTEPLPPADDGSEAEQPELELKPSPSVAKAEKMLAELKEQYPAVDSDAENESPPLTMGQWVRDKVGTFKPWQVREVGPGWINYGGLGTIPTSEVEPWRPVKGERVQWDDPPILGYVTAVRGDTAFVIADEGMPPVGQVPMNMLRPADRSGGDDA